jgi:hypothetical protein
MLLAAIKDLLQSVGQAKEQSDITITRGCNHQRVEEEVLSANFKFCTLATR